MWDLKAFLCYFCLAVWFSIVDYKFQAFNSVFPHPAGQLPMQVLALCPPIVLPLLYCLFAALVESAVSCCYASRVSSRELGGGVCEADKAASNMTTGFVGIALPVSAILVVGLGVAEAVMPLSTLYMHGWHRALVAGLMLKLLIYRLVLFLAEGVLRCRYFQSIRGVCRPLEFFVYANRLAKDLMISSFMFSTLAFGVLLNTLNEVVCPSCNLHQLLIYRARPLRPDLA